MADPQPNAETNSLRTALEAAHRQAAEATTRAANAETRLRGETVNRFAAQEIAIDTAMAQATATEKSAKERWAALQAEGNFAEAADAMAEMTRASATLTQLQRDKSTVALQKNQVENQPAPQSDPLANFSPQERDWIANNPRYMTDQGFQSDVNAAAMHAERILKIPRHSPQWFEQIEKTVYPDRFQSAAPAGETGEGEGEAPPVVGFDTESTTEQRLNENGDRHSREMPGISVTPQGPAMRIEDKPQEPQPRAVGRGSPGIAGVAAPSRRAITDLASRASGGRQISLSPEEYEAAVSLAESIDPDVARQGQQEIANWYYALLHHPSNTNAGRNGTRRARSWSREAIVA